jgi:small-conductance mechanosensitive channel
MLSTKVRSLLNEEVTVPNAVVISRETVNYSRFEDEGVAITTSVTIGYDTPWRTVHALLEAAAEKTPGLRHESKPRVLQTALSDHYPEYRLIAVIDRPKERGPVLSALHQNIQDLFHQNGIQIMSPHYVSDPEKPVIASTETS